MIQVINRAFDIIEMLVEERETPKSLSEISGKLGLNAGTCANIIKTMVDRKYIEKSDKQKGYILGPMMYSIAGSEGYKKALIRAAREELEGLTKKLNENSLVSVLSGVNRVALLTVNSSHGIQATTSHEKLAIETTSGRLLIAMLNDELLKKYISKSGFPNKEVWSEATTAKSFEKQIRKIRDDQYTIQKTTGDMIGMAVPIYSSGEVIASLGVYMPAFRYKPTEKGKIILMMKRSADKISKAL